VNITMIFRLPFDHKEVGFSQNLPEHQSGLIPGIGDQVNVNGIKRQIMDRCFSFHAETDTAEIEFEVR